MSRIRMRLLILTAAVVLAGPLSAAADPIIFQSAIQQPTGVSGSTASDVQFIGARFFVTEPVKTTRIGAHFTNDLDVFGALVRLSGAGDFPDSVDLSSPDVLGGVRITSFTGEFGTSVFTGELTAELRRGWHALVFGSGLFGTELSSWGGALTTEHQAIGNPRFFMSQGLATGTSYTNQPFPASFTPFVFVEADQALAPVPEPGTLLMAMTGLGYFLRRRAAVAE